MGKSKIKAIEDVFLNDREDLISDGRITEEELDEIYAAQTAETRSEKYRDAH